MATKLEKTGQVVPEESRTLAPFEDMDRFFNRMWEGGWLRPFDFSWPHGLGRFGVTEEMAKVDVIERDTELLVRAVLPGMTREDLDVSMAEDYLTIKAEHREEKKTEEKGQYHCSEIYHGSVTRTVHLPTPVDGSKTTATFRDGVLEIALPKTEQLPKQKIEVA